MFFITGASSQQCEVAGGSYQEPGPPCQSRLCERGCSWGPQGSVIAHPALQALRAASQMGDIMPEECLLPPSHRAAISVSPTPNHLLKSSQTIFCGLAWLPEAGRVWPGEHIPAEAGPDPGSWNSRIRRCCGSEQRPGGCSQRGTVPTASPVQSLACPALGLEGAPSFPCTHSLTKSFSIEAASLEASRSRAILSIFHSISEHCCAHDC